MAEKIEAGQVYEGKVVRIKPFGAIVSLPGNVQGLVHISHISNSYVQNVEDHLAVGDVINVKVLSADPESGKISLSMKETPQREPDENEPEFVVYNPPRKPTQEQMGTFEEKFKDWLKASNERQAGLNKRNKRR